MRKEPIRKVKKFNESEKVRDLEFGGAWYGHLSNCFYHSDLPALKSLSYFGGVGLSNSVNDKYAFAALPDYLAHQVMTMLLYATLCLDGVNRENKRFEKAVELLREKKTEANHFKDKLIGMAANVIEDPRDS